MRTLVGTRMILGTGFVTALTIGGMAAVVVRAHRTDLIQELTRSATQLSDTVMSSTYYDMLENRRENLRRQIVTIGGQEGIEKVRLFNKDGRIMFSSNAEDIGQWVDKRGEACYACHAVDRPLERLPIRARTRIFKGASGYRVLGIINPIHNQPSCYSAPCHAHDPQQTVLGVLDVTIPLTEVDRQIAATRGWMVGLALAAIAASSAILSWLNRRLVLYPVRRLAAGTRRVAEGDLTTTIEATGDHELGDLARAFNEMTHRLAEAQRQLTQADKLASVGRLAAGIAHEINNPLTGVLTYGSYLLKRAEGNPELKEDLEVIVRETKRCRDIVKGMLDFARQAPPNRQPIDLNEVARRAVAIVVNDLTLHHVSLRLDLSEDLPRVSADPNQMQQVIVNLLVNAGDAITGDGGSIRLATAVVLQSPWGHAPIRRATCSRGCDLIDSAVKIGGLPSIQVRRDCGGQGALLHLDPVYGRFKHIVAAACGGDDEVRISCPRCGVDLGSPDVCCRRCGGPTFSVQTPKSGAVEWCARNGCHWAHWELRELEGHRPVVEIVAEDNGLGIPAEDLPQVFEPFFSTKGMRGTGLGLAVTWGIVEAHGGTIDVWSEVGKGSRFTVRLPLEPAATGRESEPAGTAVPP
jgi:two-component system NtrC family sensor kinase